MIRGEQLYDNLYEQACPGHVILDDRVNLTIGSRLSYCQYVQTPDDMYEVRLQKGHLLTESQVIQTVRELYTYILKNTDHKYNIR